MQKLKSAEHVPGHLVDIKKLSRLKGPSVRQIRTLVTKKIVSCYKFGWRSMMFSPEQFDRDIAAFEVKAVNRNGRKGR